MNKFALIFGITGQDGSYLSEILLEKKYNVWGLIRRSSNFNTQRLEHIRDKLELRYGDITDYTSISNIMLEITKQNPDILEIYNLAAQSHVQVSFQMPYYTGQVDAMGTLNILECIKNSPIKNKIRMYQASTSELYGKVQEVPQKESTPFYPRSPYAVAKLYSYWIVKNYRESYNLYACNGILFNHSSPRRPENFILKKITAGVNRSLKDENFILNIGNLNSKRDIGFAKEYCYGMWLMLQQNKPDDFVLATGKTYSIRELIEKSFKYYNIQIEWKGEDQHEYGIDKNTNRVLVKVNKKYFRPCEVDLLIGDPSKAMEKLKWKHEYSIDDLIKLMIEKDF